MLARTHQIIALFVALLLFNKISNNYLFVIVVALSTLIPDIDSSYSKLGKHIIFRPLQFFVIHRGIFHSFFIGILFSIVLYLFYPIVGFGFFIGYNMHIITDSLTKEGTRAFWPFRFQIKGYIKTDGIIENIIFFMFFIADSYMILKIFGLF
ncbi:MAG: metal-dependent hydrolase [Nanoarchaeota archaeon]|nr:metal-dependent hydrolase [Nanoarchaeota archaeon]